MIVAIQSGDMDNHLGYIIAAAKERRNEGTSSALDTLLVPQFRVGMKVRFKHTTHPTYLRGATATITKVNQKRVKVKLDNPMGRFGEQDINVPLDLLEAA